MGLGGRQLLVLTAAHGHPHARPAAELGPLLVHPIMPRLTLRRTLWSIPVNDIALARLAPLPGVEQQRDQTEVGGGHHHAHGFGHGVSCTVTRAAPYDTSRAPEIV